MEIWKDVLGYEGLYKVSSCGRLMSLRGHHKILKLMDKKGYSVVNMTKNCKQKHFKIHRLVLMAFSPVKDMHKLQVNHIDGNKKNNHLSNLEWVNGRENVLHAMTLGLRINFSEINEKNNKLSESDIPKIRRLMMYDLNDSEIAHVFNIEQSQVNKIRRWLSINNQ